jgi:CheY-like chemotaxis protein
MLKDHSVNVSNRSHVPAVSCYKALVVDDYRPAKQLLGASLAIFPEIGEIDYASSGEEALAKVVEKHYDIIFLDIAMPGIDGFSTCSFIREIGGYEITPIIMVSGSSSPDNQFRGLIAGCTSYLSKPIRLDTFRKLNSQMINWLEEAKAA